MRGDWPRQSLVSRLQATLIISHHKVIEMGQRSKSSEDSLNSHNTYGGCRQQQGMPSHLIAADLSREVTLMDRGMQFRLLQKPHIQLIGAIIRLPVPFRSPDYSTTAYSQYSAIKTNYYS